MGNVRFILSNAAGRSATTGTYPRIINGNAAYIGAPALVENGAFTMSNALNSDRHSSIWEHPALASNASGETWLELDTGTPKTISFVAILGVESVGAFPSSCIVEALPGSTYLTTGWTSLTTINMARDNGAVLSSPFVARYWRFRFPLTGAFTSGFSIARVFLGATSSIRDLGFLYTQATETIVKPKTTVEGFGRVPTVTKTGRDFRKWSLQYANNDKTTRDMIAEMTLSESSFVFISPDDQVFECISDGDEHARTHIWAPPDRYAFTAEIRSLP
jgi:hypothetical protein